MLYEAREQQGTNTEYSVSVKYTLEIISILRVLWDRSLPFYLTNRADCIVTAALSHLASQRVVNYNASEIF